MLEIIIGSNKKPVSTALLVEYFQARRDMRGILYVGYPIVGTPEGPLLLDAMLISQDHGLVIFDIIESTTLSDRVSVRDALYNNLKAKLLQHKELVEKRDLKVGIDVITYAPTCGNQLALDHEAVTSKEEMDKFLVSMTPFLGHFFAEQFALLRKA